MRCLSLALLSAAAVGCGGKFHFDPPAEPAHNIIESDWVDGVGQVDAAHASGMSTPYLCTEPGTGRKVACPTEDAGPNFASCDAAGCHGGFTYEEGPEDPDRHLDGGDGPSCWTCHDQEWSSRKTP